MAVKNYYVILGVPRDESPGGIRSAFRDLARRHHPDIAGPPGAPAFREIVEAYRVLSDPEARRHHDARLTEGVPVRVRAEPTMRARPPSEGSTRAFEPLSLLRRPEAIRPSAEVLFDRIFRNFTGLGIPKSESPEPLLCDVSLSAEEAKRGGRLPICLPARQPCPACHGEGRTALFLCRSCGGKGHLDGEVVVPLQIPAGLRSGAQLDVSLEPWGIHNFWLRVRVGVG